MSLYPTWVFLMISVLNMVIKNVVSPLWKSIYYLFTPQLILPPPKGFEMS